MNKQKKDVTQPKRTIFIWDIHGCYDELKLLIKKNNISEADDIYFVWDYINKWPKSFKVLKYIYKHRNQFKGILGNHDYYFFHKIEKNITLSKEEKKLYKKLKEYPEIYNYFKEMPLFIETKDFLLVHWWIIPNKKLEEHTGQEITNLRVYQWKPWYEYYTWTKKIIYGHWAVQWIHIGKNVVGLDSWCCYWGFLSSYILETWELIQQWSLAQYATIDYSHINPVFQ